MSNSNPEHDRMRCDLHRFERNNYFTGKLLTPRDFITEQAYHAGTQRTTASAVLGEGSVCGLRVEPTLRPTEEGEERLDVTVTPGLAIDGCGRLVVVDEVVPESFDLPVVADGAPTNDISVYVEWRECGTESVPRTGMENACETECAPNRLVEYGEVTVMPGPSDGDTGAVGDIDFPGRDAVLGIQRRGTIEIGVALDAVPVVLPPVADASITGTTTAATGADVSVDLTFPDDETEEHSADVEADGTFAAVVDASDLEAGTRFTVEVAVGGTVLEVPGVVGDTVEEPFVDDPAVLFDAAQSYYEANQEGCSFAEGPVLLGTLHKSEGGSWDEAVFERGPIVYGNELLYAAVATHAADFDNPHQVSLALEAIDSTGEDGDGEGDGDADTDGGHVPLHSGTEHTRGETLVASVRPILEQPGVDSFQLFTVQNDLPGNLVRDLPVHNGTLLVETVDLSEGIYVVTADGTDEVVVFDDGEGIDVVAGDQTPEAFFTIVPNEEPTPEPVETERARVSVAGFDGPGGDVTLTSTDGSVGITPHLGRREIDFRATAGGRITADQRAYLRERSLLNAAWSFQTAGILGALILQNLENRSDGGDITRRELIDGLLVPSQAVRVRTVRAVLDLEHVDPTEFLDIFTADLERLVPGTLVDYEEALGTFIQDNLEAPQTPLGLQLYTTATATLRSAVESNTGSEETRAMAVAAAQDRVAEALKSLVAALGQILVQLGFTPEDGGGVVVGPRGPRAVAVPASAAYIEAIEYPNLMPDLRGLTRDEAEMHLAIRGYEHEVGLRTVDDTASLSDIGVNDVEDQSPAPGEVLQPGTDVTFDVVATPGAGDVDEIGPARVEDLANANINDVYDVANASLETLMEATNVSEDVARGWRTDATRLLHGYRLTRTEGIDTEIATTLARGINLTSEAELAEADPDELISAVLTARDEERIPNDAAERVEGVDWNATLEIVRNRVETEAISRGNLVSLLGVGSRFQPRF